jgi:polyisoprenoid-binding protein YceI
MANGRWLPLVLLTATGCSGILSPPTVTSRLAVIPPQAVGAPPEEARRFAIHPQGSILEVLVNDLATGAHTLTFDSFRGSLVLEERGATGKLTLDVDLRTCRTDSEMVASIIMSELLEVDKHPRAKLVLSLHAEDDSNARVAKGTVLLHGVLRGLRFNGMLRPRGEGYVLSGTFEMSRTAHGIRRTPDLDWMIADDFFVRIDLLAKPEKVTVEILDERALDK